MDECMKARTTHTKEIKERNKERLEGIKKERRKER